MYQPCSYDELSPQFPAEVSFSKLRPFIWGDQNFTSKLLLNMGLLVAMFVILTVMQIN